MKNELFSYARPNRYPIPSILVVQLTFRIKNLIVHNIVRDVDTMVSKVTALRLTGG